MYEHWQFPKLWKEVLTTEQKKILTRLALQLFSEWLKTVPFKFIFAEIKYFNQAEVAQNAEKRS